MANEKDFETPYNLIKNILGQTFRPSGSTVIFPQKLQITLNVKVFYIIIVLYRKTKVV